MRLERTGGARRRTAGLSAALLLASLGVAARVGAQPESATLLHCGALLAIPGSPARKDVTVVVRGGRVVGVESGFLSAVEAGVPEGQTARVVDLRERFVLPGLIDAHTHITSEYGPDARLRRVRDSDADAAIQGVVFARRTLRAGFTTVRNVGSSGDAVFALRDAIDQGLVPGPRILAAGESLSPTGGHSDATLGYREDLFAPPTEVQGIADGVAGARRAVRAQVKRGADLIKLTATGGVLSVTNAGTEQQFFEDELLAIVQTAHLLGRRVAAHAHGARGINAALRAGVDSIDHGTFLDDTSIALFLEREAYLVPTILAGKTVEERARQGGYFPKPVEAKALEVGPKIQAAFARAHAAGVKIAFGTDSGVSPHGENAREFAYMVEAGMTPMEAIRSATVDAAELLGLSSEVGTIEPGKAADLVATAGPPLVDVTELERPVFVMRAGVIHREER